MKNYTTWIGLKKGTKFKAIKNIGGHNYPLNQVLTMTRDGDNGPTMSAVTGPSFNSIGIYECIILDSTTIEDLKAEAKEYKDKKEECERKIKFLKENNLPEYDYETHVILDALHVIETRDKTQLEKATTLKELFSKLK